MSLVLRLVETRTGFIGPITNVQELTQFITNNRRYFMAPLVRCTKLFPIPY